MLKRLFVILLVFIIMCGAGAFLAYQQVVNSLPKLITLADYKPLLLTQVYDRNNKKIGEFFRERRILVDYAEIPKEVINAFVAAEDDTFFTHSGVNYIAIARAFITNLKEGRRAQGASTITQQVARSLILQTTEKSYLRKIREIVLAQEMEKSLKKEEIIYLYLNQIYFGAGAHGLGMAADTYFRKKVGQLNLAEAAILAGLPKAPSDYSPVNNPTAAKDRQNYVLNRMVANGMIAKAEAADAKASPVKVFIREKFEDQAPYYLETVRQLLIPKIGEDRLLNEGLKIKTALDLPKQMAAQKSVETGLKGLDKRQGFRGAIGNITDPKLVGEFLQRTRNRLSLEAKPERIILPDGKFAELGPMKFDWPLEKGLPPYMEVGKTYDGIVSVVNDQEGYVIVKVAEVEGRIRMPTMAWARKPDAEKRYDLDTIKKPSQALKVGDQILVKVADKISEEPTVAPLKGAKNSAANAKTPSKGKKYFEAELDQNPIVDGALLSIDSLTSDVLAMVGGLDFKKDKFNKALQAARQTGSSFKTFVYTSAIDKGYTPSTPVLDAPLAYQESRPSEETEGQEEVKVWKPSNHGRDFAGEIIFRNALVKSLNIPTVKIIEDIGVHWAADYARRLGIFSPLNMDFTLALGSSGITLFEMTKAFSIIAKLGRRVAPRVIIEVKDQANQKILESVSLDDKFEKQLGELNRQFEERRKKFYEMKVAGKEIDPKKMIDANFFFDDADQLISPQSAYMITSLLKGVIEDRDGTGGRAKQLGREVAGKTGTTNGYFDAWFLGFTAQMTTGVWVGFSQEKSIGKGEVGGRAALPIWLDYMKFAHNEVQPLGLTIPDGIVFANIDSETGLLASTKSKNVLRQAYIEGTEPKSAQSTKQDETDFYKQDSGE